MLYNIKIIINQQNLALLHSFFISGYLRLLFEWAKHLRKTH